MAQQSGSRGSWWSLTINNPTQADRDSMESPPDFVREMWYQDEIAPTTGTLHIQACVNTTQQRFGAIKQWHPRAQIQVAKNKDALKNYCQKSKTAVPGTFRHYNGVTVDENPGTVSDNTPRHQPQQEIMLELVQQITDEDHQNWMIGERTDEDLYSLAVNRIVTLQPDRLTALTGSRIGPIWNLTWRTFYHRWIYFLNSLDYEPTDESDRQTTEYAFLPEENIFEDVITLDEDEGTPSTCETGP